MNKKKKFTEDCKKFLAPASAKTPIFERSITFSNRDSVSKFAKEFLKNTRAEAEIHIVESWVGFKDKSMNPSTSFPSIIFNTKDIDREILQKLITKHKIYIISLGVGIPGNIMSMFSYQVLCFHNSTQNL